MVEKVTNAEAPISTFRGRLDIYNYKFAAKDQPEVQKTVIAPRYSERLSNKINKSFRPTKQAASSTTSLLGTKRKADDFQNNTPAGGPDMAHPGLHKQTNIESSPTGEFKLAGTDTETSLLERNSQNANPGKNSLTLAPTHKKKRVRPKSGYAPPSTFAHLPPLPDAMAPNLHVLFCGLNPGIQTARTGHAYSSPTNRFWKIMYSSGVLPVPCTPQEDHTLPKRFSLGLTNIVERPSRNGAQLSKAEMDAGVPTLEEKVRRWRPEVICLVGKSIWESVWRVHHHGKALGKDFNRTFHYGWQDESENMGVGDATVIEDNVAYADDWKGARVFVASSTSGLAATLSPAEKEIIWRELGVWVEKRRAQAEVAHKAESVVS